jgi:hypothetical protein
MKLLQLSLLELIIRGNSELTCKWSGVKQTSLKINVLNSYNKSSMLRIKLHCIAAEVASSQGLHLCSIPLQVIVGAEHGRRQ